MCMGLRPSPVAPIQGVADLGFIDRKSRGVCLPMEGYAQLLQKVDVAGNFELSCFPEKGCLRKEVCLGVNNRNMGPQIPILDR